MSATLNYQRLHNSMLVAIPMMGIWRSAGQAAFGYQSDSSGRRRARPLARDIEGTPPPPPARSSGTQEADQGGSDSDKTRAIPSPTKDDEASLPQELADKVASTDTPHDSLEHRFALKNEFEILLFLDSENLWWEDR